MAHEINDDDMELDRAIRLRGDPNYWDNVAQKTKSYTDQTTIALAVMGKFFMVIGRDLAERS